MSKKQKKPQKLQSVSVEFQGIIKTPGVKFFSDNDIIPPKYYKQEIPRSAMFAYVARSKSINLINYIYFLLLKFPSQYKYNLCADIRTMCNQLIYNIIYYEKSGSINYIYKADTDLETIASLLEIGKLQNIKIIKDHSIYIRELKEDLGRYIGGIIRFHKK